MDHKLQSIEPEAVGAVSWPTAPSCDFTHRPTSTATVDAGGLDEIDSSNFFRCARWSADGTAVLATAEDRKLFVFDTPDDGMPLRSPQNRPFSQPDAIHSTLWYPTASLSSPVTFCFVASVRDSPVRLLDAQDGRIRATYPIIDHRERFIAPHSLCFNPTATKLYCGHENAIEVLDVANPGYDTMERLKTVPTKREKGGQRGIISSLAFCPDYSGLFAAGSFSGTVSLYSEDTGGTPVQHIEGIVGGGVTQIAFHPLNPHTMFIASRRSSFIQVFDTRDASQPVIALKRKGQTNQRLWFDVDPWGRWIGSGEENGTVKIWDLADLESEPIFEEKLHEDAVGSAQFHPYKPLLLTTSGSRSYMQYHQESFSDSDTWSDSDDESDSVSTTSAAPADASMRIWSFASATTDTHA